MPVMRSSERIGGTWVRHSSAAAAKPVARSTGRAGGKSSAKASGKRAGATARKPAAKAASKGRAQSGAKAKAATKARATARKPAAKAAGKPAAKAKSKATSHKPAVRAAGKSAAKSKPKTTARKPAAQAAGKGAARAAARKAPAKSRASAKAGSAKATGGKKNRSAPSAKAAARSSARAGGRDGVVRTGAGSVRARTVGKTGARSKNGKSTARGAKLALKARDFSLPHIDKKTLGQIVAKLTEMQHESRNVVQMYMQQDRMNRDEVSDVGDDLDQASNERDREFSLLMHQRHLRRLKQIEEAFERIEEGTYGLCEGTDEPINPKRLLIMPLARYSLEYQQEQEKMLGRSPEDSFESGSESFTAEE
ncbi:MAG: hypothetical protein HY342_11925 [Candidatus Lambdaproteobacteria bacterium]|nr:hypothetical protein [Candidatus Lambdaproteobacteria bacterium]